MKIKFVVPLLAALMVSCQSTNSKSNSAISSVQESQQSAIQPIKGLEIKPEIYQVDATNPQPIELATGSRIVFPENAFVDENGQLVTGEVEVCWNEYHTLTDILLSGIPMKFDSAGVSNDLVSGGMFTIKATQHEKELQLAKGKEAVIDIASVNDTPCMNFYALNEQTGKWSYKTSKQAEPIDKSNPAVSAEFTENETSKILEVPVENLGDFPDLSSRTIIGWKTIDPLAVQGKTYRQLHRKGNRYLIRQNLKDKNMILSVVSKNNDSMHFEVKPYFYEDALKQSAQVDQKINKEYQALLQYQAKEGARRAIQMRTISIKGFGTFNWDICHQQGREMIAASVHLPVQIDLQMVQFYLITPEDNCIVKYNPDDLGQFSYNPSKKNSLIAILPDNSILSCAKEDFNRVKKARGKFEFEFSETGVTMHTGADLTNCLNEIL